MTAPLPSSFPDEDTNPDALHPTVVEWAANAAAASRHHKLAPEVIADFDRLLALAKGGVR